MLYNHNRVLFDPYNEWLEVNIESILAPAASEVMFNGKDYKEEFSKIKENLADYKKAK